MNNLTIIAASLALLALYGLVGSQDAQEEVDQALEYCAMAALYKADPTKGWPPYDNTINCDEVNDNE